MKAGLAKALGLGPRRPASEEALREAWERWHFLGADVAHKRSLLFTTTTHGWDSSMVRAYERLKRQYGTMLNPITHEKAVEKIELWEGLQTSIRTTRELHADLIESNLRWEHLDNQTAGRLAVVRAVRHIQLRKEFEPEARTPKLQHIERLDTLYCSYYEARNRAMELLMDIAFPEPLRTRRVNRMRNRRTGKIIEIDETVEDHPRGLGIPRTVPWEAEIAQLAALKRVSRKALEAFISSRFLVLSRDDQIKFIKAMHAKPRKSKNKCGTVAPWLADNAPLLRVLRAQWNDVEHLVTKLFPQKHRPQNLRTFAHKHGVKLGFKSGGNFVNSAGLSTDEVEPLLTTRVALE